VAAVDRDMASDPIPSPELEIAHVLFMDIAGYSLLPLAEQPRQMAELQELVRATREFQRAEAGAELIRLPTGDGLALVFFRDPVAPVQCAMEIGRALRNRPRLQLRMGLHSGPVYRVADINEHTNVSGGGINLAQRVMECGDAGHILLSSVVRELLGQMGAWPLHDLGEIEVKHGVRLHLFSLHTDEIGNSGLPVKLQRPSGGSQLPAPSSQHLKPEIWSREPDARALPVTLLYKQDAQPDETLVRLLETELTQQGFAVFVDRHRKVGVEWAQEIERRIRTSEAVIPLLSRISLESEMLQYELQIAGEAALRQEGKPRLLPVRVGDASSLPPPIAALLGPSPPAAWSGPADDRRLLADLLRMLQGPHAAAPVASPVRLEAAGGAVPLDSAFYVVRPTDEQFRTAIARHDSLVLVKGARQMGKTSLLARGLQQARETGARVALTDFQTLNATHLESVETLYLTLGGWLADQLDAKVWPEDVWNTRRGPSWSFEQYLRRHLLDRAEERVVWGLDEVDRLFTCGFGSEVFGLFRSWHNKRALDPTGPWKRLTLAIAYATEAHLFITDMNQSPFNVGTRLTLEDFTFEQVADLNRRYGSPLRDEAETARYYRLVGGHPHLVRSGLQEMALNALCIGDFEAQAERDDGVFGDHLRRIFMSLAHNPELCEAVKGVMRGRPCPTSESFYHLRTAGVLAGESARDARPRCQLYATYLERRLL
jgi:class 3 adenylate cyclase